MHETVDVPTVVVSVVVASVVLFVVLVVVLVVLLVVVSFVDVVEVELKIVGFSFEIVCVLFPEICISLLVNMQYLQVSTT